MASVNFSGAIPGLAQFSVVGWLDPDRLLLVAGDSALNSNIAAFDLRTRRLSPVIAGTSAWIGADRHFVTCLCSNVPGAPLSPYVFPLAHPERARRIAAAADINDLPVTWARRNALSPWIARLTIDVPSDSTLPVDGPYRLSLHGWDQRGEAIPVPSAVVEWTLSGTAEATVDRDGTVRPRREGDLTVLVSAGGWRTTSARLRVVPARYRTLLSENWRRDIGPAWSAFGDPRPFTTTGPGGVPALAENGDSTFNSGVYYTSELSPTDGFGVEAIVSTPLAEDRWQTLGLVLFGGNDSVALAQWGHTNGYGPFARPAAACRAGVPGGESVRLLDHLYVGAAGRDLSIPRGRAIRSGRWWRLRVQVLPDGRCGVAVDGKAVWLSENPLPEGLRYRLALQGMSFHTQILFGPVEVWQGVKPDIRWEGGGGAAGPGTPRR